jgi:O-antigen ligase
MKQTWGLTTLAWLCALIPIAVFPAAFDHYGIPKLALFLGGSLFLFILLLAFHKQLQGLPRLFWVAVAAFLTIQIFQTFRLPDPLGAVWGAYGQSESLLAQFGFVIFLLSGYAFVKNTHATNRMLLFLLAASFLVSLYGVIHYFSGDPISHSRIFRSESLFGDPNSLGIFLVLSMPLAWSLFAGTAGRSQKLAGWCVYLNIIALILTFSRTAWLGFLVALTIFGLGWLRQTGWRNRIALHLAVILLCGLLSAQVMITVRNQAAPEYTLQERLSSYTTATDSGRGVLWSTAWRIFKSSPLTGYGLGSFQDQFHRLQSGISLDRWSVGRDLRQAHNEILHYLATQGILGLAGYLFLVGVIGYSIWSGRSRYKGEFAPLPLALNSGVIGYLICMQFAYPLVHYSYLFWLYLGILLGLTHSAPEQLPEKANLGRRILPGLCWSLALLLMAAWGWQLVCLLRADALYQEAFYQARHGQYPLALANFRRMEQLAPWCYQYRYRHALILVRYAGFIEEQAIYRTYLERAALILTELSNKYPERYQLPALQAEIDEQLGEPADAARHYRHAVRLFPANYQLYFRLGRVELLQGNHAAATRAFAAGVDLNQRLMKEMMLGEGLIDYYPYSWLPDWTKQD